MNYEEPGNTNGGFKIEIFLIIVVENGGNWVIKVFVVLVITANSVAETVSLAPEIIRGGEAVGSVFSILDRSTKIDPDDSEAEPVESIRGEIELRHVDFSYPSRPDITVFKDLNLRIRAGQSQALVGASGSGKALSLH